MLTRTWLKGAAKLGVPEGFLEEVTLTTRKSEKLIRQAASVKA